MRLGQDHGSPPDPRRLLEADGPAAAVLRAYARRTGPDDVTRWLPPRDRGAPLAFIRAALGTRAVVASGLLAACLGLWLSVHPPRAAGPHDGRGGAGGSEGASGSELGVGGGHGRSGAAPTAASEIRQANGWS
jgi:hypothetical protein